MLSDRVLLSFLLPLSSWPACHVMSWFKLLPVDLSLPDPRGQWVSFGSWLTTFESMLSKKKHFCFPKRTIMNAGLFFSIFQLTHRIIQTLIYIMFIFHIQILLILSTEVCAVAGAYCKQGDKGSWDTVLRVLFTPLLQKIQYWKSSFSLCCRWGEGVRSSDGRVYFVYWQNVWAWGLEYVQKRYFI